MSAPLLRPVLSSPHPSDTRCFAVVVKWGSRLEERPIDVGSIVQQKAKSGECYHTYKVLELLSNGRFKGRQLCDHKVRRRDFIKEMPLKDVKCFNSPQLWKRNTQPCGIVKLNEYHEKKRPLVIGLTPAKMRELKHCHFKFDESERLPPLALRHHLARFV